ncbi:uncharacterized protein LOC110244358 [Exaiptasia diaphana]|uniref:Uncharacterized protein n=1 Tax=Exaiptasia diaphana TaxID=2652724 RepID=A0A913XLX8_EXADI|nr:uncharacterized protein LOC110244358 [Exaiptasia diaphana]
MESAQNVICKQREKDIEIKNPPKTRQRSRSLFEAERPKLTETDRGVFVLSHADFPKRERTQSDPTDPDKFVLKPMLANQGKIKKIIHDIFENALATKSYNAKESGAIAALLAAKIRDKVSELQLVSYKLACTCLITKRAIPAPVVESGCVWNSRNTSVDQDSFVEFLYKSQELYALGTVYGIYDPKFEKPTSCKSNSGGRPSPIPE